MMIVALAPLLVFFFLRDWYTSLSADNDIIVEGLCFLATAGLLYMADHLVPGKKTASNMRVRDALLVGTMQGIAPLPRPVPFRFHDFGGDLRRTHPGICGVLFFYFGDSCGVGSQYL